MKPPVGIIVHDGYEYISNAYGTTRLGYLHGFQKIGMQAEFVEHGALYDWIDAQPDPVLWLTYDDYNYLGEETLEAVRACHHIVQVNTWFDGMEKLHRAYDAPSPAIPEELRRRILDSVPDFAWCSAPEPYLEFYEGWAKVGMKVISLPWACDAAHYYPVIGDRFEDVEMAYVGGYRAYKERQYGIRLWPYNERLRIWGYSEWPRCYQGYLPNEQERELYSQAGLCPTISEPQFCVTGDTVERPFKIMGCRGLTILDMPCYHDLFSEDEALIAYEPDTYHWMVSKVLTDEETCIAYRERGYRAIMERHTYAHRAQKIVEELGL